MRDAGCVAPVSTTTPAPKGASRTPKPAFVSRARSVVASHRAGCRVRGARASFQSIRRSVSLRPNCTRSEEHTSELQSHSDLVCRLLLEKKKKKKNQKKRNTTYIPAIHTL